MKKLTLDETWVLCLKMWRWIAKVKRAGSTSQVAALKRRWLKSHGFKGVSINHECFFCEYDDQRRGGCKSCPAKRVDKNFGCRDEADDCFWNPNGFYNKVNRLNKKRLAKKKPKSEG